MSRKSAFLILCIVILISIGLRLYQLNAGLWLDEMTTYLRYAKLPFIEIVQSFESENQHFLYSILAHASFLLFGESTWALRLPAVIFGIASIVALFLLGLEISDPLQALLASALMAFSYHHIWFSQNARGYIGLLFFTILSSWLLLRAIKTNRTLTWLLFAVSAALGVYTHLTMIFVIAGQFVAFLFFFFRSSEKSARSFWQPFLAGFIACGVMILVLHAPVVDEMRMVIGGTQTSDVEAWKSPLWTLRELVIGLRIGFSGYSLGLVALAVFTVGIISFWKTSPEFVLLFVLPPLFGAGLTIAIGHHLWPRFFFFAMGFGSLIVIRGMFVTVQAFSTRLRLSPGRAVAISAVLCTLMILVSASSIPGAFGPKQDYQGALQYLQAQQLPGDRVATIYMTDVAYHEYFKTSWDAFETLGELQEIEALAQRTWVVYTFPQVLQAKFPAVFDYIDKNYELIREFDGTVGDGVVLIFRRSAAAD